MNIEQASDILDCGRPQRESRDNPREHYLKIIGVLGYTKIKGKNGTRIKVSTAPNYQLYAIAKDYYEDAEKVTHRFWRSIDEQIMMEDAHDHEVQLRLRGY